MLSDNIKEPLLDLGINELINILQSFANDPSFNVHQTSFVSNKANHATKEKMQRYNNETMIPPNWGCMDPKNIYCCRKRVTSCYIRLGIKC
jgi:hypothetical protein